MNAESQMPNPERHSYCLSAGAAPNVRHSGFDIHSSFEDSVIRHFLCLRLCVSAAVVFLSSALIRFNPR
jgi:hypothetical protein